MLRDIHQPREQSRSFAPRVTSMETRQRQNSWAAALRDRLSSRLVIGRGVVQALMAAVAAVVAYVPAQQLGLQEGFWGAITAIAVLQTEFRATRSLAIDQSIGASIGGVIGLAMLLALGSHLATYAAAVTLALLACWTIGLPSASRLAGITATIILLVPHTGSALQMFLSRVFEVGWGVCVSVAVVWISARLGSVLRGETKKP